MTALEIAPNPAAAVFEETESPEISPDTQKMLLDQIGDYVFTSKYARYLPDEKRRETWGESVSRVEQMHLRKYDFLSAEKKQEISEAFDLVRSKRVLPSMRAMQFGGAAIEAKNERMYNCCVTHIHSIRSFAEVFFLLLCGCGVGTGLSKKFLNRLPDLANASNKTGTILTYVIEDNIEGWADSVEALLSCYFINTALTGRKIVFDYSKIRPAGSPLRTGGGKAPGYEGLKAAHKKIKALLDDIIENQGVERLRSIDAYDIMMHCSDAVLSGGVRRSAMSIMFEKDDELMINAKTGDWYETHPHRARSNNSVLLIRDELEEGEFEEILERTREWGEPGFVFADHPDTLYNPCFEIGFLPVTEDGVPGVQFCNLTSINGAAVETMDDFFAAAKASAIIGTLQAGYTDFPYLSGAATELTRGESLLGVSITGILCNPDVMMDGVAQNQAAKMVIDANKEWAHAIGIPQAARNTTMKPEGTGSWVVRCTRPGSHPSHAPKFFRRVQANKLETPYQFFKALNPDMCEESVWSANKTDDVITFPIVDPAAEGIFKEDLDAVSHLDLVKSIQNNWVIPGTSESNTRPVNHNVSVTVIVDDEDWASVSAYVYKNRQSFSAISFLSRSGDKDYAQAPFEAVSTPEDEQRFQKMIDNFVPVDYRYMVEIDDGTAHQLEASCAGGACTV